MPIASDPSRDMPPSVEHRVVAGILVGGRSRRMGRPKLTLPLPRGSTLVEHVVEVVSGAGPWLDEIVVLGLSPDLPESLAGLRQLPDVRPEAGPLAGLCALLREAGPRWGLLLACDMPLLHATLLRRLWAAASSDADAVAYAGADRPKSWHACCALYHPRILPAALEELNHRRSLQNLLDSVRVTTLSPTAVEQRMLSNVNTPQDYQALLHQA